MNQFNDLSGRFPSRHANPFATCWTRPGALPFQFPIGVSAKQLLVELAANNWRGEIVGPHGSGKSTLVETLRPHLAAAGRSLACITLREGQRRLSTDFVRKALASARPLLIVDGYEQLSLLSRMLLRWRCRRATAGLLVTSHTTTGLPLLCRTRPNLELVEQLVSTLTASNSSPVSGADVVASHACHGSNLRELLFALYDRHEALTAAEKATARTSATASA